VKTDYHVTFEKDQKGRICIWGTGKDREASQKDAEKSMKDYLSQEVFTSGKKIPFTIGKVHSMPCTHALYKYIKEGNGTGWNDPGTTIKTVKLMDLE
jgi:hypothetical protein